MPVILHGGQQGFIIVRHNRQARLRCVAPDQRQRARRLKLDAAELTKLLHATTTQQREHFFAREHGTAQRIKL